MPIIEATIHVDAPAADLFALSLDSGLRRAWDPFTRRMQYLEGATKAGKGVRVCGRAWNGLSMEVEMTSHHPPRSVAMTMRRGPWFFRQFAGTWLFRPCPEGGTEVTFRYLFTVRPRWLRPMLEPVITWVFRRDVWARVRGLKRGAEVDGLLEKLADSPCS